MGPPLEKEKNHSQVALTTAFSSELCINNNNNDNDNIKNKISQLINNEEIEDKITPKKKLSVCLSQSYNRLNYYNKSLRVLNCGTYLEYQHIVDDNNNILSGKLHSANFCKDRLCPLCAWRRSLKIFSQVSQIMENINDNYDYLFLTLTIPSVNEYELIYSITNMMNAFNRLTKMRRFTKAIKGYFRALEITRNNNKYSKSYNLYHPHFHCVLVVNKSYFKSNEYINRDLWLKMWQKVTDNKDITQVDVRRAKDKSNCNKDIKSVVAEITKYTVKSNDYIFPDNPQLTDNIVYTLNSALKSRRLIAYGGIFREIYKKLKLDDPENGDLNNIDNKINDNIKVMIIKYGWSAGCYKILDISV